jgi:hypothetical protein
VCILPIPPAVPSPFGSSSSRRRSNPMGLLPPPRSDNVKQGWRLPALSLHAQGPETGFPTAAGCHQTPEVSARVAFYQLTPPPSLSGQLVLFSWTFYRCTIPCCNLKIYVNRSGEQMTEIILYSALSQGIGFNSFKYRDQMQIA